MERPLQLPCGAVLGNRLAKAALSDELGDGRGVPTPEQTLLYRRWAQGGVGLSLLGETQIHPCSPESPGNLVLNPFDQPKAFRRVTQAGASEGGHFWAQLGHAGALAALAPGAPRGPSALDLSGLHARALTTPEIEALPEAYASAAANAVALGFTGVEVHAAHGFLLSQFLSPFFNRRTDRWGGTLERRARLLLEVLAAVRGAVGASTPVGVKVNATDQLEGGLETHEALDLIGLLDATSVDLIDISGGAYVPGAVTTSDRRSRGPYFLGMARAARARTDTPLMTTGGFKTMAQASAALDSGATDVIGLGRALVLEPELPRSWLDGAPRDPAFPKFRDPPVGGVTTWFTDRIASLPHGDAAPQRTVHEAIAAVEGRREKQAKRWRQHFF